uniref:Uncharacterized protein n=1 Tax=Nelumbo nucifera TaxID=4432 RepID=A0A822Z6P6_NELNU|nr:TPA_asm: hypothetical protein HUJ06_000255 [Nelumbo nucifera]
MFGNSLVVSNKVEGLQLLWKLMQENLVTNNHYLHQSAKDAYNSYYMKWVQ